MRKLPILSKRLLLNCLLIVGVSLALIGVQPVAAASAVEVDLNIDVRLEEATERVTLLATIRNNSAAELLREVVLPNIWQAQQVSQFSGPEKTFASIVNGELLIQLTANPLRPGASTTVHVELLAAQQKRFDSERIFSHKGFAPSTADLTVNVKYYDVSFAEGWGLPWLNLLPQNYDLSQREGRTHYRFNNIAALQFEWRASAIVRRQFTQSAGSARTQLLARLTPGQTVDLGSLGEQLVGEDDSGNLFWLEPTGTLQFQVAGTDERSQTLGQLVSDESPLAPATLSETLAEIALHVQGESDLDSQLRMLYSQLAQNYTIDYSWGTEAFSKPSGKLGSGEKLKLGEYLLVVAAVLNYSGKATEVVLWDLAPLHEELRFGLTICEEVEKPCAYYRLLTATEAVLEQTQLQPLGYQALAFATYSERLFAVLASLDSQLGGRQIETVAKVAEEAGAQEITATSLSPLALQTSGSLYNFTRQNLTINFSNTSNALIFPEQIELWGRSYSLTSLESAELHLALAPGQTRAYRVVGFEVWQFRLEPEFRLSTDALVQMRVGSEQLRRPVAIELLAYNNYRALLFGLVGVIAGVAFLGACVATFAQLRKREKSGWKIRQLTQEL